MEIVRKKPEVLMNTLLTQRQTLVLQPRYKRQVPLTSTDQTYIQSMCTAYASEYTDISTCIHNMEHLPYTEIKRMLLEKVQSYTRGEPCMAWEYSIQNVDLEIMRVPLLIQSIQQFLNTAQLADVQHKLIVMCQYSWIATYIVDYLQEQKQKHAPSCAVHGLYTSTQDIETMHTYIKTFCVDPHVSVLVGTIGMLTHPIMTYPLFERTMITCLISPGANMHRVEKAAQFCAHAFSNAPHVKIQIVYPDTYISDPDDKSNSDGGSVWENKEQDEQMDKATNDENEEEKSICVYDGICIPVICTTEIQGVTEKRLFVYNERDLLCLFQRNSPWVPQRYASLLQKNVCIDAMPSVVENPHDSIPYSLAEIHEVYWSSYMYYRGWPFLQNTTVDAFDQREVVDCLDEFLYAELDIAANNKEGGSDDEYTDDAFGEEQHVVSSKIMGPGNLRQVTDNTYDKFVAQKKVSKRFDASIQRHKRNDEDNRDGNGERDEKGDKQGDKNKRQKDPSKKEKESEKDKDDEEEDTLRFVLHGLHPPRPKQSKKTPLLEQSAPSASPIHAME
jgi:hypothetical protein